MSIIVNPVIRSAIGYVGMGSGQPEYKNLDGRIASGDPIEIRKFFLDKMARLIQHGITTMFLHCPMAWNTGQDVSPAAWPNMVSGLRQFLRDNGLRKIAREIAPKAQVFWGVYVGGCHDGTLRAQTLDLIKDSQGRYQYLDPASEQVRTYLELVWGPLMKYVKPAYMAMDGYSGASDEVATRMDHYTADQWGCRVVQEALTLTADNKGVQRRPIPQFCTSDYMALFDKEQALIAQGECHIAAIRQIDPALIKSWHNRGFRVGCSDNCDDAQMELVATLARRWGQKV